MNFLILYDSQKINEINEIVEYNKQIEIVKNKLLWKLTFLLKLRRIDCIIAFSSSLKSKNVAWELSKLELHHILILINDDPSISINNKINATIINMTYEKDNIANLFQKVEKSYSIGNMFNNSESNELEKEFMFKMLETSESLINRRQNTNNFMLSANGIIITLVGVLFGIESIKNLMYPLLLLPIIGIIICLSWHSLLSSFGKLNKAKFEVISYLENRIGMPIFTAEWKYLSRKSVSYKSFTKTECWMPILFGLVYIAIIILIIFLNKQSSLKGVESCRTIFL